MRVTARWTGFQGAPGYSNFHFTTDAGLIDGGIFGDAAVSAATTAAQRVADAFSAIAGRLPEDVDIRINTEVEVLDSDSGQIIGMIDRDTVNVDQPSGSGGYSAASGAVVNWNTRDYRFGRRIRGRTFLVPLVASAYEDDGSLNPAALNTLQGFGEAIVGDAGGPEFGVWSRPRSGAGGVFATATSFSIPDMAAILRSRRD